MSIPLPTPLKQDSAPPVTRFGNYLSSRILNSIILRLAANRKISFLDVGCGYDASILYQYKERISFGLGLDIEFNKGLENSANINLIPGDITRTIFEINRTFDLIAAINFIEHLSNPLLIVSQLKALLNPDGILFMLAPTWLDKIFLEVYYFKLSKDENGRASLDEHKMYYNKKDLWKLLIESGFKSSQISLKYKKFGLSVIGVAKNETRHG